jgi:hypothetical protein
MRIVGKIVGGLMMAGGAFMLLGFVAAWAQGDFHYSLGIQFAVLFCSVLMPLLLGFLLLKKSSTTRIDIAVALNSSVTAGPDARPNDDERGPAAVPNGASLAHSSSSINPLGTHARIRFSLTRFDLFKVRAAGFMTSRPLQVVFLLIGAFAGYSGFTAEFATGESVGFRVFCASIQVILVLGSGFFVALLLDALQCFTGKAKGVIGEHTLEVTDEGLRETTEYNSSLYRWSGFHKMKQSSGFLWVYVTDTKAHVVPLDRPLLEGDVSMFVDQIRSRVNPAEGNQPEVAQEGLGT